MIRATAVAVIVLVWFDQLAMDGRFTAAAVEMTRSVLHFVV